MRTSFFPLWILFALAAGLSPLAQARTAPDFGESITWAESDESPSLANLEGKAVLVVFFQSWCGICNKWSGALFKDIEKTYQNNPAVVIVALKTDGGSTSDALDYLSSRANTSQWLVGVDQDASYYKTVAGFEKLYYYTWIKPDGTIGETAKAGEHFVLKNGKKNFTIAAPKNAARYRKGAQALFPEAKDWGEDEAVAAAEHGQFLTALKLMKDSQSEGAQKLKTAIGEKVDSSIATLSEKVSDATNSDRYPAFLKLEHFAESFGSSPQGKAAQQAVNAQQRQPWMRDEQEAHKDYLSIMKRAGRAEDERDRARIKKALQKLADEFPATYYGRLATTA